MCSEDALTLTTIQFKADHTYRPVKNNNGRHWHARTACGKFAILTT